MHSWRPNHHPDTSGTPLLWGKSICCWTATVLRSDLPASPRSCTWPSEESNLPKKAPGTGTFSGFMPKCGNPVVHQVNVHYLPNFSKWPQVAASRFIGRRAAIHSNLQVATSGCNGRFTGKDDLQPLADSATWKNREEAGLGSSEYLDQPSSWAGGGSLDF